VREGWAAWGKGFNLAWSNLVSLIGLNLLWLAVSWLVIPAGPATLAAYWWIATALREDKVGYGFRTLPGAFRRFFWKGLVWGLGWTVLLFLAYTNLTVWGEFLPPFATAVVEVVWIYGLLFAAAMQPHLLEFLTMEELPWGEALKRSVWQVVANPIYSHMYLLIPAIAVAAGVKFQTPAAVVLVSLVLAFAAAFGGNVPWKYGEPRPNKGRIEDVL